MNFYTSCNHVRRLNLLISQNNFNSFIRIKYSFSNVKLKNLNYTNPYLHHDVSFSSIPYSKNVKKRYLVKSSTENCQQVLNSNNGYEASKFMKMNRILSLIQVIGSVLTLTFLFLPSLHLPPFFAMKIPAKFSFVITQTLSLWQILPLVFTSLLCSFLRFFTPSVTKPTQNHDQSQSNSNSNLKSESESKSELESKSESNLSFNTNSKSTILDDDQHSTVKILQMVSRQVEKLGVRFRVTRRTLRDSIQELSSSINNTFSSLDEQALKTKKVEKTMDDMQLLLFSMQDQAEKQFDLFSSTLENMQNVQNEITKKIMRLETGENYAKSPKELI